MTDSRTYAWVLLLSPACLDSTTSLDTSSSSSTGGESSTSSSESSTTSSSESSSESSTTSEPPACDEDPACGPGEDVYTCPEQCNECGDGVVVGPEGCDNGVNEDAVYSEDAPEEGACGVGCEVVRYCGDGIESDGEGCDEGGVQTGTCEADCREPMCGDGVQNAAAGEGCDDENTTAGDGCSEACVEERRVFTTSAPYKGDLNYATDNPEMLTGIALGDARCNGLAEAAGLPATFKAWLSDGESSPSTRFDTKFAGHYRLLSAEYPVVATGWSDLTDGSLAHALDADEKGNATLENVLTNTAPDGTAASQEEHCSAWTKNDNTSTTIGQSTTVDATWTSLVPSLCSDSRRIYCFEDP